MSSDDELFMLEIKDSAAEVQGDITIADGVMDTANGGWITCTPENMLMYDMAHRSGWVPEEFEAVVKNAWAAGYTPKMFIEKKEPQSEVDKGKPACAGWRPASHRGR